MVDFHQVNIYPKVLDCANLIFYNPVRNLSMALIEWRKEDCTGINGIDHEHEQLIDQINGIYALIDDNSDKQLVVDGLGDIYGSISAHFALEEQMMEQRGYAHYQEHKADHVKLLDDIGDIVEHYENTIVLDSGASAVNDFYKRGMC